MGTLPAINLGVRFLLELCALAALGYWGFQVGAGWPARLLLGLGAPLAAAVAWGVFVAPASGSRLADPARLLVEVVIFGAGVAALAAAGRPALAWALGLAVAANLALMVVWGQRGW